ncbi:P-loop containing nucleoside triphosphate hydrolase protein [Cladochytrium replicatum]|nr:P-loop containing nucleoside triphosphate hydrolase protein [Cladochytrium replicatum]
MDLSEFPPEKIRNFSIIAHIDHGKSTLADRMLEYTGTIRKQSSNKQVLDKLKVERERGITVKAQTASMIHTYNGEKYLLNLIDTPGHVDFSYEVSRSLAACQGTILLVDATQGIQAQTVANFYLAFSEGLTVLPVINKIDLPSADPDKVSRQIQSTFELGDEGSTMAISAKSGINIDKLLDTIVEKIPPPPFDALGSPDDPLRFLLFDSWYDRFVGVVCLVAVVDGKLSKGDKVESAHYNSTFDVADVGLMYPDPTPSRALLPGQVGYAILGMKTCSDAHIGDTFFRASSSRNASTTERKVFPGFKPAKSMVFSGVFPIDSADYDRLSDAIDRLTLNDRSVSVSKETSAVLGQGFRLGFLGTLHMDVFRQRLEEEWGAVVINTAPTVPYIVRYQDGTEHQIRNPTEFPDVEDLSKVKALLEPMVLGTLVFPLSYMGTLVDLCVSHRGQQVDYTQIDESRAMMRFKLPMSEILVDFYDQLKSRTAGYASFDYEEAGYEASDLVKINVILNGKVVDALSSIVYRGHSERIAKDWVKRLKDVLDRQLFEIAIQASVNGRIVSRETIKALRKDVTAKCYGGDITRKMKLLERVKEGKKRMKRVGNVDLPHEAFYNLMRSK